MSVIGAALGVVALLHAAAAGYVQRHRNSVGGRALLLVLLAIAAWTAAGAAEVSVPQGPARELFGDLKYVGIVLLPPALLSFALEYTGRRRRMGPIWVAALSVEPVLVLAALAVPTTRSLVRYLPPATAPGELVEAQVGPLFWVHAVYSYAVVVVALGLIVLSLLRVSRQHVAPAWALIVTSLLPLVVNGLYNLGLFSVRGADPTPLGFGLATLVLVWGFFRFRLVGLIPVGRRQVVEGIPDGVLVLDLLGHVVDANSAGARLTGLTQTDLIGRRLVDVVPELGGLWDHNGPAGTSSGTVLRAVGGEERELAATFAPLPGGQQVANGRLLVLHDVTDRLRAERRLRELVDERTGTIEVLRRGLFPAQLPHMPGLQVAAVLDQAEAEAGIGGDFVDVRATGQGRWTMMVGDVVGKGAGAATLTALARHTTNALAALGWQPSAILREVNRALALDTAATGPAEDARFCTMVLADVERVDDGANVLLALAGHPRPMHVTANGRVSEVGVPGSLLGVLARPELHDTGISLRAGESLVLFTDGVLEARRDDDAFGEQRLAELVSRLAGQPPERMVEEIVRAVRDFGEGYSARDDVAVLVLSVPVERAGARS